MRRFFRIVYFMENIYLDDIYTLNNLNNTGYTSWSVIISLLVARTSLVSVLYGLIRVGASMTPCCLRLEQQLTKPSVLTLLMASVFIIFFNKVKCFARIHLITLVYLFMSIYTTTILFHKLIRQSIENMKYKYIIRSFGVICVLSENSRVSQSMTSLEK